jgi:hypothetical protein
MKERHYQKYLAQKRKRQQTKSIATTWEVSRAANGPVHEWCLVPHNLFEQGIGNLAFSRALPDGSIALAMFLLDIFCLGVKNALFAVLTRREYDQRIAHWPPPEILQPMAPACFRKLVEGGVDYARSLGLEPHADYGPASQIFGDVEAAACPTDFTYGRESKPFYISGPNETPARATAIVNHLRERLGEGNFDLLVGLEEPPSY